MPLRSVTLHVSVGVNVKPGGKSTFSPLLLVEVRGQSGAAFLELMGINAFKDTSARSV